MLKLVAVLEQLGFLERTEDQREYRLGIAVLRLGFEYLGTLPLNEFGLPLLERLSNRSHYPCNLVVRDGRFIVYVAKVTPQLPFSSSVSVGNMSVTCASPSLIPPARISALPGHAMISGTRSPPSVALNL